MKSGVTGPAASGRVCGGGEGGARSGYTRRTTVPPARLSGNGNLTGGSDDLRGAAWWLVPKGEEERVAKGAEK